MAKKELEQESENFLFDLEKSEVITAYLKDKSKNEDGLYRPKLEQAKDKKNYYATVRILPNLKRDGKLGPTAIEKHLHYADFKSNPEISGYYDCLKNFDEKCDLCTMYWALKNSKNPAEQDKAKLISRSTKYYSYVLIVEDENQPELNGKIMIFPFGYKIKQMIADQLNHPKKPSRVEDLSAGKEFFLHIKEVGGFVNYDSSKFEDTCAIKIPDAKGVLREIPLDSNGKIEAKYQAKVKEFLLSREKDLEDFNPVKWTEEQTGKIQKILGILSGQIAPGSSDVTMDSSAKTTTAANLFSKPAIAASSADDFFNSAEEEVSTATERPTSSPAHDPFFEDDIPF